MVDLNRVVIDGDDGLNARLRAVGDHRKPKGTRDQLAAILLVCATAMLSGAQNPTEVAGWAAELPDEMRLRLHLRRIPSSGAVAAPTNSTTQRALRAVDREALDRIVCETLAQQVATRRTERDDDNGHDEVAGPGKSLRGAVQPDGRAVHLLSAMTQARGSWSPNRRSTTRPTRSSCSARR